MRSAPICLECGAQEPTWLCGARAVGGRGAVDVDLGASLPGLCSSSGQWGILTILSLERDG